jgi:hypothetical protein
MRRSLHLLLAFSLLFLSWYQLAHELKAHAGQSSATCEICLFTGYLGHGAPSVPATPPAVPVHATFAPLHYAEPVVTQPFLLTLNERGPPIPSIA